MSPWSLLGILEKGRLLKFEGVWLSSRRILPALALVLLGASYNLPGSNPSTPSGAQGFTENGYHRVARDSRGFWYYVWDQYAVNSPVYLSYTTTSTPGGPGDWGLVTLVAQNGTGVIAGPPANNMHGRAPSIAIDGSDALHLIWDQGSQLWIYYSKCPSLTTLTASSSWATPVLVNDPGAGRYTYQSGFVLDSLDVPYVLYTPDDGGGGWDLSYTKYDTSSGTFLPGRKIVAGGGSGWADLGIDLQDNLYVAYCGTSAGTPFRMSLLACANAFTTSPAGTTWRNLAQTTTDPDVLSTNGGSGGPLVLIDYTGILHVVWGDNTTNQVWAADGILGQGWRNNAVRDGVACKHPRGMTAFSNGDAYLFSLRRNTSAGSDDIYVTRYTSQGWESPSPLMELGANQSQGLWTERRAPSGRPDTLAFALDTAADRSLTSFDSRLQGVSRPYEPFPASTGGGCFLSSARSRPWASRSPGIPCPRAWPRP